MRTGRPKVALILTDEERQRLESLAHRSRSAPHVARRARIILACGDGSDSKAVARRLHVTPATVCTWRGRFVRRRLDGLYDEPRPGARRTITDEQVEQVIIRTLETTPRGATHWSSGRSTHGPSYKCHEPQLQDTRIRCHLTRRGLDYADLHRHDVERRKPLPPRARFSRVRSATLPTET